jgi:AraC-like DNA-binding protein
MGADPSGPAPFAFPSLASAAGARQDRIMLTTHQEVHRLGGYGEYAPPPDLAHVVEALWVYARPLGSGVAIAGRGHRVLPDPTLSICLSGTRDADGRLTDAELFVLGPVRTVRYFNPTPGLHLEAIRLKFEWCRELLGIDPAAHVGGLDRFADAAPRMPSPPPSELFGTIDSAQALGVLLRWIGARVEAVRASRGTTLAHRGLESIRAGRTATVQLPAIARELALSERHLRRVVKGATGASPKSIQRTYRLNRAVAAADRAPRPDWAALAADAGYFDQSHLINEFRSMTGALPTELHAERRMQQERPESPRRSRPGFA